MGIGSYEIESFSFSHEIVIKKIKANKNTIFFFIYELVGWEGGEGTIITPCSSFSQDIKVKKMRYPQKDKIKKIILFDLSLIFKCLKC